MKTRRVVSLWAERMERVLQRNDHKTGWVHMNETQILHRLDEEIREVLLILWGGLGFKGDEYLAYRDSNAGGRSEYRRWYAGAVERLLDEIADVSNFAAFLNERRQLEAEQQKL